MNIRRFRCHCGRLGRLPGRRQQEWDRQPASGVRRNEVRRNEWFRRWFYFRLDQLVGPNRLLAVGQAVLLSHVEQDLNGATRGAHFDGGRRRRWNKSGPEDRPRRRRRRRRLFRWYADSSRGLLDKGGRRRGRRGDVRGTVGWRLETEEAVKRLSRL